MQPTKVDSKRESLRCHFDGMVIRPEDHRWTGFLEPVTLKESDEYQCVDCGVRVKKAGLFCLNGTLYKQGE